MKITEAQIRSIIRQQLIKEFRIARVKRFNWTLCKNVDLPDHLIKTKDGRAAIKRIEKAAALAAQVYGVPGMFCDIFSSMMGDNPNRKYNRDEDEDKEKPIEDFAIYAKAISDFVDNRTLYTKEIQDHMSEADDKKEKAAKDDFVNYQSIQANIEAQKFQIKVDTDPRDFLREMNDIIGIDKKYGKAEVKKLISLARDKKDPDGPRKICKAIASDARMFVITIANQNLKRPEISTNYASISSYIAYHDSVSRSR